MIWIKLPFNRSIVRKLAISLAIVSLTSGTPQVQAQPAKPSAPPPRPPDRPAPARGQKAATTRFVLPPLPPRGAPGQGRGEAGSRGPLCPKVDTPLTALVPVYETPDEKSVWGLTIAANPTFWFYVPYSLTPDLPLEFRLQDEENWQNKTDEYVYQSTFTAHAAPGVVSLRLPPAELLEIGKRYIWTFVIRCGSQESSANIFVEGWVERIAPSQSIVQSEPGKSTREHAVIYAKEGIWYETLTALAELLRADPKNAALKAEFATLLRAGKLNNINVDLNNITELLIAQCCSLEK